jgi:cell division protein ZapA
VRKTAKKLNEQIAQFKSQYAGKDMQDYISMVLLWFATEQQQSGQNLYELENVQNQIETLKNSIERAISGT